MAGFVAQGRDSGKNWNLVSAKWKSRDENSGRRCPMKCGWGHEDGIHENSARSGYRRGPRGCHRTGREEAGGARLKLARLDNEEV